MKRFFDFVASVVLLIVFCLPMLVIGVLVKMTSPGPVFFTSKRVGQNNILFSMIKFRTMKDGTPSVATHLLEDAQSHVTCIGNYFVNTAWTSCHSSGIF